MRELLMAIKIAAARLITSNFFGRLIQWYTRGFISYQQLSINTNFSQVNPESKASLFWGLYEKSEVGYIQKYLPKNSPVIELGSSLGVTSCVIGTKIFPEELFCVEANPALVPIIETNLKRNGVTNARVMNVALGEGIVYFQPGVSNTVGHVAPTKGVGSIAVSAMSLSEIVNYLKIDTFSLVCDIEGSECHILFEDFKSLDCCTMVIIELHQTDFKGKLIAENDMINRLIDLRFKIAESHGRVVVAIK